MVNLDLKAQAILKTWGFEPKKPREILCETCQKPAVTFHGLATVHHGYCEEHRCCYSCGLHINKKSNEDTNACNCQVSVERPEYLRWWSNHA